MVENNMVNIDGGSKKTMILSSSSKSYISNLSDELLVEILCRIGSSKYATRCKCICKRWFSLVKVNTNSSSDSYFLQRWRQIHHNEEIEKLPIALLTQYQLYYTWEGRAVNHHAIDHCFNYNSELPMFKSLNFLPCNTCNINIGASSTNTNTPNPICILATFKDLVLCCPNESDHSVYYLCNPLTRQWRTLPRPPPLHVGLEPSKYRVGLIVSDRDDYDYKFKVVRIVPLYSPTKYKINVDIFSSDDRTNKWRQIVVYEDNAGVYDIFLNPTLVSYNGTIVWLSRGVDIIGLEFNDQNADTCSFFSVSFSTGYTKCLFWCQLGVCNGRLRIAQLFRHTDGLKLVIWQLNSRQSQSWELVNELNFSEIVDSSTTSSIAKSLYLKHKETFKNCVMAFHPHDGDIMYLLFTPGFELTGPSYIFLCNVKKKTFEIVREIRTPNLIISTRFSLVQPCWPTQVPLFSNSTSS